MREKFFILFAVVFLLSSCHGTQEGIRTLSVGVPEEAVKSLNLDKCERIDLKTEDTTLLSRVNDVLCFKDGYVIISGKRARYFSNMGEYVSDIGRIGRGPGEYMELSSFYSCGDTVCLYSYLGNRTLNKYVYSDGHFDFAYSEHFEPFYIQMVYGTDDFPGCFFVQNAYAWGNESGVPVFSVLEKDMNETASSESRAMPGGFVAASPFSVSGESVYYSSYGRDTIWAYHDGRINPAFRYDFGNSGIKELDLADKMYFMAMYPERFSILHISSIVSERYVYALLTSNKGCLISVYDLDKDKAMLYHPVFENGEDASVSAMFMGNDGNIMLAVDPSVENMNENPALYILNF